MALDKSSWSKTIKVSQSQIDAIKGQGMVASLKKAALGGSDSYVEGVKRLYGANRLAAATKAVKASPPVPGASASSKPAGVSMARPGAFKGTSAPAVKRPVPVSGGKAAPVGNYRGSSGKVPTAAAKASGSNVLKTLGTVALTVLAAKSGGGAALRSVGRSGALKPTADAVAEQAAARVAARAAAAPVAATAKTAGAAKAAAASRVVFRAKAAAIAKASAAARVAATAKAARVAKDARVAGAKKAPGLISKNFVS